MAAPIDHKTADDTLFIEQVIAQVSEMKLGFKDQGFDPYALPEHFTIQVYPAVFIRIVDLLARAKDEGFNIRLT